MKHAVMTFLTCRINFNETTVVQSVVYLSSCSRTDLCNGSCDVLPGPPIWLSEVEECVYEQLGRGDSLDLPTDITLSEDSDTQIIGLWGEILVNSYLQKLCAQKQVIIYYVTVQTCFCETVANSDFVCNLSLSYQICSDFRVHKVQDASHPETP